MENTEHGGVERQQEQKFGKFECEYKDEKGDVVCVAKFEIVPEESADSKETTARPMLKSLKLEAIDESGQKKNIDVLAIANPRNFPIAILDEQGIHSFLAGHVNAPAPRNQINLAVLFHELGHGDQISEKKFQNLDHIAIKSEELPSWLLYPNAELIARLNEIAKLIPTGKTMVEKIPTEVLRWLENVFDDEIKPIDQQTIHNSDKYQKLNAEYQKICRELSGLTPESDQDNVHTLLEQRDAIEKKMSAIETEEAKIERAQKSVAAKIKDTVKKYQIAEILCLPLRLIEQDATRRAMSWFRQIKEAGVDLLTKTEVETASLRGHEHSDQPYTTTSVQERTYEWLKSYDPPDSG